MWPGSQTTSSSSRPTETLGQSEVVFKYELGAEASCPRARRFLELHAVIERYLAEAYAQIAEPGAAADRAGGSGLRGV